MKLLKFTALLAALMLAILPLAACSTAAPAASPVATPAPTINAGADLNIKPMAFKPVDQLQSGVYNALTGFSLDLFKRLAAAGKGGNVFISPLSVWLALSMTYNGASGTTALGMAKALHAEGVSVDDLNRGNAGLMGVLTAADPNVQIQIANSIWMSKQYANAFNKDFLDRDQTYYAAQIRALNFADEGSADTINNWVEQSTNGNIKGLVQPPIDAATVMFLINAVHFKAPWKQAFDPKMTRDGVFNTADGAQTPAKFLYREEGNIGFADKSVIAARIPYSTGRLEMVAIMPEKQALADFANGLTADILQSYIDRCKESQMSLTFPKFKLEYSVKLNDALIAMGMKDAFASADFTNMSSTMGKSLVISEVRHKSLVEVNEEGTEASAATSVEMKLTAVMDTMNLEFTKPFIYLIRDTKTGAILFMGAMEKPA